MHKFPLFVPQEDHNLPLNKTPLHVPLLVISAYRLPCLFVTGGFTRRLVSSRCFVIKIHVFSSSKFAQNSDSLLSKHKHLRNK